MNKTLLFLFCSLFSNVAFTQIKNGYTSSPTGIDPAVIVSFTPASAAPGDTVTIQLGVPAAIVRVEFGGVPAASFSGGLLDAVVKAVVGSGSSGRVQIWGPDYFPGYPNTSFLDGFFFIAPDIDVTMCYPVGSNNMVSNLTGSNYQWEISNDSLNFVPITDNSNYSGCLTGKLLLTNIPSTQHGYKYRCIVDGNPSRIFTLKFENYWVNVEGTDWNNPINWSCGIVPDSSTNVVIDYGDVTLNQNVTVNSLTIRDKGHLTVATGVELTVKHQ